MAAEIADRGVQGRVVERRRPAASARARRGRCRAAARAAPRRRSVAAAGTPRWASGRSAAAAPRRPSRAKIERSSRPYLIVIVCQPAASNIAPIRPAAISGTTRSSDWRLRSTIHSTSPSEGTIGSTSASQIAPSSSSASPISATSARLGHVEVAGDVPVGERGPQRLRRADPDRAGREIDGVGILGSRRDRTAGRRTRAARSGTCSSRRPSR